MSSKLTWSIVVVSAALVVTGACGEGDDSLGGEAGGAGGADAAAGSVGDAAGAAGTAPTEHPHLFLSPERLAFVRAKAAAQDPDFLALKAYADARTSENRLPDPEDFNASFTGDKSGYRGSLYKDNVLSFALLTWIYKDSDPSLAAKYAQWGMRTLDQIIEDYTVRIPGVAISHNEGLEAVREFATMNNGEFERMKPYYASHFDYPVTKPPNYKGGYMARNLGFAMAVGYDSFFSMLSAEKRVLYRTVMRRWISWYAGRRDAFNTGANYDGTFYHEDRDGVDGPSDNSDIAGPWGDRITRGYGYDMESGNFFGGYFLMHALSAHAMLGDDEHGQSFVDSFREVWQRLRKRLEDPADLAGGDLPEGWQYGSAYQAYLMEALLGIEPGGQKVYSSSRWPAQTALAYIHATSPAMDQVHVHGEWTSSYVGLYDTGMLLLGGYLRKQGDPVADLVQYHLNHASYVPQTSAIPWVRVMFRDAKAPEKPFDELPLLHDSTGTGLVQGRSSWSKGGDTIGWALAADPKVYGDHEAHDGGHLTISRGNDHLLFATGQLYSENQNLVSFSEPGTKSITQNPRAVAAERRVRQDKGIQYAYCDLTQTSGLALHYSRQAVFFVPDAFLVVDRMESKPGESRSRRWHFNTGADAIVDGATGVITTTAGQSRAEIRTLYPTGYLFELADVAEGKSGAIRSAAPAQRDYFVNLILPGDRASAAPIEARLVESGSSIGAEAELNGRVVVGAFGKGDALGDGAQFGVTLAGARSVLVADLGDGAYRVEKDGKVVASGVQATAHTIVFADSGPGGSYAVVSESK
jgi:hypothetical protein